MSVGVPVLDDDHRIVLGVLTQLADATRDGEQADVIGSMVIFFCDYVLTHMRREERLMERLGYPDLMAHRTAHGAFAAWAGEFRRDYEQSPETPLAADTLAYPGGWWVDHVNTLDMAYKPFFQAHTADVQDILDSEDLFEIYGFNDGEPVEDPVLTASSAHPG
ncbi:MAG: hemerythrin family protein [Alphaproteobacteria bacterium]